MANNQPISSLSGIAQAVEAARTNTEIASLGLPNEITTGRRDTATRLQAQPLPNTATARDLMIRTFNMELEMVNATRAREGRAPLVNLNALNAHAPSPFIQVLTKAIADAERGVAFSGQSVAIPAGGAPAQAFTMGTRVRFRAVTDMDEIGVPWRMMDFVGVVDDFDDEDDNAIGVYFDHEGETYFVPQRVLEVVIE